MKKIIIAIFFMLFAMSAYSQVAFRVVAVSPNYPNVYPRYSTLQQVYNAIKDSAKASTGKYFVINLATATENITDWSGTYKDSIVNRSPYMRLTQLGQAIGDSIIGITAEEFNLIAGILSLDPSTAGDGISFGSHQYIINKKAPIVISNDTLQILYSSPIYLTPNTLGLKRYSWSGLQVNSDSGLRVLPRVPLKLKGDTLYLNKSNIFGGDADSLWVDWNTNHFTLSYNSSPSVSIKLDSGLTSSSSGVKPYLDNITLKMNSDRKMYVDFSDLVGSGLLFTAGQLKLLIAYYTMNNDRTDNILAWSGDSLQFNYNPFDFKQDGNGLALNLDSGLQQGNGLQIKPDFSEMTFTADGSLQTATTLWGGGLYKSGDSGNVRVNEFAKIENDTVKIKTSYIKSFYGDSLTTNVTATGLGVQPYDSTGVPVLYTGKIKRITYTYQLSSNNDTVITLSNNTSVTIGDKIRCIWVNASSEMRLQKWSQGSRSWSNSIAIPMTGFANKKWRIEVESIAEAE